MCHIIPHTVFFKQSCLKNVVNVWNKSLFLISPFFPALLRLSALLLSVSTFSLHTGQTVFESVCYWLPCMWVCKSTFPPPHTVRLQSCMSVMNIHHVKLSECILGNTTAGIHYKLNNQMRWKVSLKACRMYAAQAMELI